jgi:hypothetical protein
MYSCLSVESQIKPLDENQVGLGLIYPITSYVYSSSSVGSRTNLPDDASQGAGHANHTHGNGAEFAQDPLSLPSGPITRLRAKRFKEALNGLIQENGVDSKKTKMGPNNDQGLVNVIKAIDEVN